MTSPFFTSHRNPGALIKPDVLLVVFIHGFKGTDDTFATFPARLGGLLSPLIGNAIIECVVYPKYKTKGDLETAVDNFSIWLVDEVVKREGGDTGRVKVVLCGHSMGGLVAADALIRFAENRPSAQAPLFPRIIACLSFDTPYLGLHTRTLVSGVAKVIKKPQFWLGAAATTATVVAAAAVSRNSSKVESLIEEGFSRLGEWVEEHLDFVVNLWKKDELKWRLDTIVGYDWNRYILFRTFYTLVPSSKRHRSFIDLPSDPNVARCFLAAPNHLAKDEIHAHKNMFRENTNMGYYQLEWGTSMLIRDAFELARRVA